MNERVDVSRCASLALTRFPEVLAPTCVGHLFSKNALPPHPERNAGYSIATIGVACGISGGIPQATKGGNDMSFVAYFCMLLGYVQEPSNPFFALPSAKERLALQ